MIMNKYLLAVILVLLALLTISGVALKKYYSDNKRLSSNSEQLAPTNKADFKTVEINKDEIRQFVTDSVLKAQGVRKGQIQRIVQTEYKTCFDTVMDTVIMTKIKERQFKFKYNQDCFYLAGKVFDSLFVIEEKQFKDSITDIYYTRRNPIKWLFNLRIGAKRTYKKTISKCNGTTEELEINITK